MCEKPSQPMIRLRGLCRDSALQNLFTPVSDEKGQLMYVGLSMTNIVYNETTFLWVATNMGYHDAIQLLEYQTNVQRCRFDTLGKSTPAHCSHHTHKRWVLLRGGQGSISPQV